MSIQSKNALLTEHLQHTPVSLLDDIIDSINKLAWKAIDAVEAGLSSAPSSSLGIQIPSDPTSAFQLESAIKLEIESGAHKLETLLGSTIDKNFDKLEVVALRSIVSVPEGLQDWIRLSHYEGLDFRRREDAPSVEAVREQRKRVFEAQRLQRLLIAEEAKNQAIIAKLMVLRGIPQKSPRKSVKKGSGNKEVVVRDEDFPYPVFTHLVEKGDLASGGEKNALSTTTRFALSQLPALKGLESELRPMEKSLVSEMPDGEDARTWRKERTEYIEKMTRRHLESKGVEMNQRGEIRDGDWQGGGRRFNKGEVEELEAMVGLMGGEKDVKDEERDDAMPGIQFCSPSGH